MATNLVQFDASVESVICSDPATPVAGDPVRVGSETGVALTNESANGNASGYTTVDFGAKIWDLSVKAVDDSGNSAVVVGDALFYVDADTPKLSKKSSGYFYGFAREAITSGSTDTINVKHVPSPGAGTLGTGTVGATQLASGAVTAPKLSSTLKTGTIPLPLVSFREIGSNDIINTAGDAGMLSSNTTPKLYRENTSTDKKLLIEWAASNSDEIVADFPYPPDLDDTAPVVFNGLFIMSGSTDTPTVAVSYFEGVGDSNAGGNTAALSNSLVKKTVSIAASDIGASPTGASIGIVPGAHTTDKVQLLEAWIEYTRK